jgi:very-short-patch-repair endonuclease
VKLTTQLERAARAHDGLITLNEWIAAGNSRAAWFRQHPGLLISCGPGVARIAGSSRTPRQRIRAAVLSTSNTLASHRSAAYLWGIEVEGAAPVDLIAAGPRFGAQRDGIVIHRPTDLADLRPVARDGIPTTSLMRTLLDLGAVAPASVGPALEGLLIAGTITVPGVCRTLSRHRTRGRDGVRALERALESMPLGDKPPDSVLEPAMARLLDRAGIRGWVFHQWVGGIELDFGFASECVDVEVDGWASHSRRGQFERDRERDAELGAIGWLVLRFSWTQVTRRPSWVASRLAATLASRSA